MQKKTAFIIIAIILLIIIAVFAYYFLRFGTIPGRVRPENDPNNNYVLPGGQNPGNTTPGGTTTPGEGGGEQPAGTIPKLRMIWGDPVSGYVTFNASKDAPTSIRFIERAVGHIHETRTDSLTTEKISSTRIPKVYDAIWNQSGNALYIRYLNEGNENIETFYASLKPIAKATSTTISAIEYSQQELQGSYLTRNIQELLLSPKGNLLYTTYSNQKTQAVTSRPDGSQRLELFTHPIKEWEIQWPQDKTISLTTKASAEAQGHLFFFNTDTRGITQVLSSIDGLTTNTNTDATQILYSLSRNNSFTTHLYNPKTKQSSRFPLVTLPEKCVWSKIKTSTVYCAVPQQIPSNTYPDSWYQGLVSFSDDLWMVDTVTGTATILLSPFPVARQNMDMTKLSLTPKEDFILFINKNNSSFWSLDLRQN